MEAIKGLNEGLQFKYKFRTTSEHSARHVGSGDVEVLSTPSMIKFMEEACRRTVDNRLPGGYVSVGTLINVRHVAAAPVNDELEVKGVLLSIDGRRLTFWVEALWRGKKIGYGIHERVVVKKSEFIEKLRATK